MSGTEAKRESGLTLIKPVRPPSAEERGAILTDVRRRAIAQAQFVLFERADLKDIAQQTVLGMLKELKADPDLWADESRRMRAQFTITARAIIDLRRSGQAMRDREPDEEVDVDALPAANRSPLEKIEWKEFLASLGRALCTLSARARQIWSWRYLDDLMPAEIVPLAGIDIDGIYSQLYKANVALRPAMRAEGYNYPPESES